MKDNYIKEGLKYQPKIAKEGSDRKLIDKMIHSFGDDATWEGWADRLDGKNVDIWKE